MSVRELRSSLKTLEEALSILVKRGVNGSALIKEIKVMELELNSIKLQKLIEDYEPYAKMLTLADQGAQFILGHSVSSKDVGDYGEYFYYYTMRTDSKDIKDTVAEIEEDLYTLAADSWNDGDYEWDDDLSEEENDEARAETMNDIVYGFAEVVSLEKMINKMTSQFGIREPEEK